MTFIWPQMLWTLLMVPGLALAYWRWQVRPGRLATQLPGLRTAGRAASGRWRHLPAVLLLAAITLWLTALGRPAAVVSLPSPHETVMLAIDTSGSMRASDMSPNRLGAAQQAARQFIAAQPASTRIGIVGFAGTASLVQAPTDRREDLMQAIERMQAQRGTAIGSAIVVSLATLFPGTGIDINSVGRSEPSTKDKTRPEAVPAGSYDAAVIVLLTDGQSTAGPEPVAAAKLAAQRGVRVYTVGIGTTRGEVLRTDGWSMRVGLDESTLKAVADLTRGEYFQAQSTDELKRIYRTLNSRFVTEKKEVELGALLAAIAAALSAGAAAVALLRTGRIL